MRSAAYPNARTCACALRAGPPTTVASARAGPALAPRKFRCDDARQGDPLWEGIAGFAGHPLLVNGELVGVLAVYCTGPISDAVFTGLGSISAAIAVGIQRKTVLRAKDALEAQLRQSQKMEAVGRLAGGIAHDFNNILTVIMTCSEFLLDDLNPLDPARKDVVEISKAGRRAADLTRQLLMFSRQQVLEPRVLDLVEVTIDMESMLRRVLGEDIELVLENDPQLGRVRVDPGSIEQVIVNLVVNARDAMPKRRHVEDHHGERGDRSQVRRAVGDRHGNRDGCRHAGEDLRALLHDQAARERHGPRTVDAVRHRPGE